MPLEWVKIIMEGEISTQPTCSGCNNIVKEVKGTMCGPCYRIYKKYYRDCLKCGEAVIKPESEDESYCSKCNPDTTIKDDTTGVCKDCNTVTDAKWKIRCTPCYVRSKGSVQASATGSIPTGRVPASGAKGVCKYCNKKLDADWKTTCTPCWKANK